MSIKSFAIIAASVLGAVTSAMAHAKSIGGVECRTPPAAHCGAACTPEDLGHPGNATDATTGRKFFLDYPCDLKADGKAIFILNLHGASSRGAWQRHYFPALDYVDKYRLVVATPTANGEGSIGGPPMRMWTAAEDDAHLVNVVNFVIQNFGENIRSFWLVGHSQGGMTSNRLVCTDFFEDKVDGWLSLSGGRIGRVQVPEGFLPKRSDSAQAATDTAPDSGAAQPGAATAPGCDLNYIFASGEHEIVALPTNSPWADKYGCKARVRQRDIVDVRPGYVRAEVPDSVLSKAFGLKPRPGTAQVFVYPDCRDGKLVADVVRMDKGHTEGLEPLITEALIKMIVAAPGGKIEKNH